MNTHVNKPQWLSILCFLTILMQTFSFEKAKIPTKKLWNGDKIPSLGIRFSREYLYKNRTGDAVLRGVKLLDSEFISRKEHYVGHVIGDLLRRGAEKRENLFIISKLWNTFHRTVSMKKGMHESLRNLRTHYLDLYLIHWPMGFTMDVEFKNKYAQIGTRDRVPLEETWRGMEELVKENFTKHIGLANFNLKQIKKIVEIASIKPSAVMIELNPYIIQRDIIDYCLENNIVVLADNPYYDSQAEIARRQNVDMTSEPVILNIAQKYNRTVIEIIHRFVVELGAIPVTHFLSPEEIELIPKIFEFKLTKKEVDDIAKLDLNLRAIRLDACVRWPDYPFTEYTECWPNIL